MSLLKNKFISALFLALVVATSAAFAGPEDRQKPTCFVAERADAVAPARLCLLDAWLSPNAPVRTLTLTQSERGSDIVMTLTSIRSDDGHRFQYQATKNLLSRLESGCGESEQVDLIAEFEGSYAAQYIDVSQVTLRAVRTSKLDVCHSSAQTETIQYRAE